MTNEDLNRVDQLLTTIEAQRTVIKCARDEIDVCVLELAKLTNIDPEDRAGMFKQIEAIAHWGHQPAKRLRNVLYLKLKAAE